AITTVFIATILDEVFDLYTGLSFKRFGLTVDRVFGIMKSEILVALPMFILMGNILDQSGVAENMMKSLQRVLGNVPGGLALGVTIIGIMLAASTGIIGASVVLLGTLTLPAMMRLKYSPELATGTVCSAGTLGILIPPSIMLILMATQLDVSTGDLFMGAVFPGLILGGMYLIYIVGYAFLKPQAAPKPKNAAKLTFKDWLYLIVTFVPAIILIALVLGSIFFGIATPTESSGMGAMGALLLAFGIKFLMGKINKGEQKDASFTESVTYTFKAFRKSIFDTLHTMGFLAAIFIGATCFSYVLRRLGGDEMIAEAILGIGSGNYGTIFVVLLIIFALGFFLEWIEITMIMLPIVGPMVGGMDFAWIAESGMDPTSKPSLIWFAILCAVALQTSFLTPPVGFALFYIKGVAPEGVALKHIYKGVVPFIIIQLIALALVILFPQLVTWLPGVSY
ncbi:MAG: TRAP transporter large permease subunit, partial [Verrucomicrobiota bacterium]